MPINNTLLRKNLVFVHVLHKNMESRFDRGHPPTTLHKGGDECVGFVEAGALKQIPPFFDGLLHLRDRFWVELNQRLSDELLGLFVEHLP